MLDKLSSRIAASETVDKAVILAMDGYVTEEGILDKELTQIYVPNDYVARETARFDNLIYGASINPHRKDTIERLRAARRDGAVLVKWIPSTMNIDPADPGGSKGQDNFERILPLFAQYTNLYVDISSLTQVNKLGYLARALDAEGLTDRMR
jgi:hypothetical protein